MAIYKEDIVDIELTNGNIHRSFLQHSIGAGDEKANRFGVRVFRNGQAETLGSACSGYFIRSDGNTVVITNGTVVGNIAYVTLPETCYAVEGNFSLAVKVATSEVTSTLRIVDGVVNRTSTDVMVDPGTIMPSIDDLIAAINAAVASIPLDYSTLDNSVRNITGMTPISMSGTNQYIKTNGAVGSTVSYTASMSTGYQYAVVNCAAGDTFTINADGGDAPRTWCFVDNNDKIISRSDAVNASVTDLVITAPTNAVKLIINDKSGRMSFKGSKATKTERMANETDAIYAILDTEEKNVTYTNSYYINASGTRTYNTSWGYGMFSAKNGDVIKVNCAGIAGTTAAIYRYDLVEETDTYTPLVVCDRNNVYPYTYEVIEDGTYGVNTNFGDPTTVYIMKKNATAQWIGAVDNAIRTPALVERDHINRYSTTADMLLTQKLRCIYHDNFDRADVYNNIGYNFTEGGYIDIYDTFFPVGIYNKAAYASNPSSVVGKHFKLFDAQQLPYVVEFTAKSGYNASVCVGYIDLNHQINVRVMGGENDRYIRINYAGQKPEENYYDQYRKFTRVAVAVWPDKIDVYLDGRYFFTLNEAVKSTLCGMMFSTGADYRYDWFSVYQIDKFEEIGFDDVIEDYGLVGKGYTTETGNVQGIVTNTSKTLDSGKSIRFTLQKDDEMAQGSKRSEIGLIQRKKYNLSNKIYSFDIYFDETDYQPDSLYEIIFQLHTFGDDDNYDGLVPSTSLVVQNNVLSFSIRGQSDKAQDNDHATITTENLFTIETGRWYHFVIYQREAYTQEAKPLTLCFVDGECLFYSENINSYNVDNGTYPKWGIYKTPWKEQSSETTVRRIYVDNIRMWY